MHLLIQNYARAKREEANEICVSAMMTSQLPYQQGNVDRRSLFLRAVQHAKRKIM